MIPNHVLNDLKPDERVAVLSRGSEIHFHVHPASASRESVRVFAEREGSAVLTTQHARPRGAPGVRHVPGAGRRR